MKYTLFIINFIVSNILKLFFAVIKFLLFDTLF